MIDLNLLREKEAHIKQLLLRKEPSFDCDTLLKLDHTTRSIRIDVESIRKEKNNLAAMGAQGVTSELREKAQELSRALKEKEEQLKKADDDLKALWLSCPNIPSEDLPLGNKEANKPVRFHGEKQPFSFQPKHHLDLNQNVQWFDLETATELSGTQFVLYREQGAKMIYALTRMMLRNNAKHGFTPVIPPALVQEKVLYNSGNLPKFEGDFYRLPNDGLCLIPTAEVSLTSIHANQIVPVESLPIRYTAWTSCFRREAGGYGANDRGLIRIHQFEKVELYTITQPEHSVDELERMVACAETLLKELGLHYRVSLLAAQDCSFSSAKTYDIELWMPGQNQFYEVSSCSNCTDFQARRAGIRYRKTVDSKPSLVHTLNASSLALPRLMVALMETYQQEDGSITLPSVLQKEMDALW